MQADDEQQDVGRPEVDAADDGAEGVVLGEVVQACPGLGDRRDVEESKEDAGDQLKQDQDQRGAAERVEPRAANRHRLVETLPDQAANRGSLVEPVVGGGDPAHQTDSVKRF